MVLAAGASSRLGQAKQLVELTNQPLIVRQCELALSTGHDVFCVLGCKANAITPIIENLPIKIVVNDDWDNGIGTSIACAINHIEQSCSQYDGAMIVLCDQWQLSSTHLCQMINQWKQERHKVLIAQACSNDVTGPPVIFPSSQFNRLTRLTGDSGAKVILKKSYAIIEHYFLPEAFSDLDTPEQLLHMRAVSLQ